MTQNKQRSQRYLGFSVLLLCTAASPLIGDSVSYAAGSPIDNSLIDNSPTNLSQAPSPAPAPTPAPVDPTLDLPSSPTPVPAPAPAPTTPLMIDPPLDLPPSPAPAPVDPTLDLPPTPAPVPAPPAPAPPPPSPTPPPPSPTPPPPAPAPTPAPTPPPYEPPYEPTPPPYEPAPPYEPPSEPTPAPAPAPPAPPPGPTLPPKSVRQSVVITPPPNVTLPSINVDDVVPGVLGEADYQAEGNRVDFYQFEGEADQRLVAVLRNSNDMRITSRLDLAPYMLVLDPNGQVIAGTIVPAQYRVPTTDPLVPLDNQLYLRLPQSGRYTIAVFAEPNQTGRYGLSLKEDDRIYRLDQVGELTDASPTLEATGTPSMATEINGEVGQRLQIEATSYEFDPRLILVDAAGTIVAEDDDSDGNFNARIDITLLRSGTYRAIVVPANQGGRGSYRLTVY